MNTYALLLRHAENDVETFGSLFFHVSPNEIVFQCLTLELPWRDNEPFKSCIPDTPGMDSYSLRLRYSRSHKRHLSVSGVSGRTNILIHPGNFFKDTTGCILVGDMYRDIDGDGHMDIINSRTTLDKALRVFKGIAVDGVLPLRIVSAYGNMRLQCHGGS